MANTDYARQNPTFEMRRAAKKRARKRGLPFDLKRTDIVIPEYCPVLGIPLFKNAGRVGNNSPTIDRIDPAKGYTKDNILVISYRANKLKGDATLDELKRIYSFFSKWHT